MASTRPSVTHANFLIGEFGAARDISGECDAAARARTAILALESWGASYGIFWQAFDNDPASGIYDGFGLYRRDRSISLSGDTLKNLYTTGTPAVPVATCATINPGGVVNGTTFKPTIHPGDVISIFGSNFSASGNVVWIKQGAAFRRVATGSPWWHESASQINATLPAGVVAGDNVNVAVTDAAGRSPTGSSSASRRAEPARPRSQRRPPIRPGGGRHRLLAVSRNRAEDSPGIRGRACQQCALSRLEDVSRLQRNPEALEVRGLLLAVMELLAGPSLWGRLGQLHGEDVPSLDLEAVRADVVSGLPELPDNLEVGEAGLLASLAKGGLLRRLVPPNAAGRYLDADLLIAVVDVPENQAASRRGRCSRAPCP